jgi:hypothetical protein
VTRYSRPAFELPRLSQVVKKLIIALSVAYIAQLVLENWLGVPVAGWLALSPGGAGVWQLVTYVFVDRRHPVMFCLGLAFLWLALSRFEIGYGARRTLELCLATTLGASVPAYLAGFALPGSPPLYGAFSLWMGGFAATTWSYGNQPVSLFGLLTLGARQLLWLLLGLSVLIFLQSKDHTQLIADLGAIASGIGFVRYMKRPRSSGPSRKPRTKPSGLRVVEGGKSEDDRPKWLN